MSPEKMQLLNAQLDKVRQAAEEAVAVCGLPVQRLPMGFNEPVPAADAILELAKIGGARNPGLLHVLTMFMPAIAPARLQGAKHDGPNRVKKGERGKKQAA